MHPDKPNSHVLFKRSIYTSDRTMYMSTTKTLTFLQLPNRSFLRYTPEETTHSKYCYIIFTHSYYKICFGNDFLHRNVKFYKNVLFLTEALKRSFLF